MCASLCNHIYVIHYVASQMCDSLCNRIYVIHYLASSEVPSTSTDRPVTRQATGSLPEPAIPQPPEHMSLTEELNSETII